MIYIVMPNNVNAHIRGDARPLGIITAESPEEAAQKLGCRIKGSSMYGTLLDIGPGCWLVPTYEVTELTAEEVWHALPNCG